MSMVERRERAARISLAGIFFCAREAAVAASATRLAAQYSCLMLSWIVGEDMNSSRRCGCCESVEADGTVARMARMLLQA
jgi:hypothetical protein